MSFSLRPSRFGILGTGIAAIFALGCSGHIPAPAPRVAEVVVTPSHSDTVQVYQRALQTFYESTSEAPGVIVLFDSATAGRERSCPPAPCQGSPVHDSHVEASTLRNYEHILREGGALQRDLQRPIPIQFISAAELATFPSLGLRTPNENERHGQSPDPFWDEFRRRFPRAWGLTSVTRIGFSDEGDQALVQVHHGCGGRCGRTETMFLEKRGGTWFVESRFPEISWDWIGQGDLRYVGPDSKMRAEYFRELDAKATAIVDSIRKDNAPRRIRGTVINRAFGTPIVGAQIFVRSPKTEPAPWARIVADSLGRFEVSDAPIGTIMLEVQCPGPTHRPGATLDAPGFYLLPAMDTTVITGPPDLRPCWNRAATHRLTAGEVESGENRTSQFPADAEADVLSAVLRQVVVAGRPSTTKVLAARTYTRCNNYEACSSLRLPQLTSAGVLDSTATIDFRVRSQQSVPINTQFAAKSRLRLLTESERRYLSEEGYWRGLDVVQDHEGAGFWKALASSHNGASEIISLTRPGFNSPRTQALVEVKSETQDGQARNTVLLKRVASGWTVARQHLEKETLSGKLTPASGKLAGGKCVPTRPGTPPTRDELMKIRGEYEFEMISSVGGGPDIQARMQFFPDTSAWAQPKKEWSEAERKRFESLRKIALPVFIVIDPRTRKRMKFSEAGTYISSGKNYFGNAGHTFQFDGFGFRFEIHSISETGIFGSWEHYSFGIRIDSQGNPVPEPSGHFCARKVSPIADSL